MRTMTKATTATIGITINAITVGLKTIVLPWVVGVGGLVPLLTWTTPVIDG